MWVISSWNLALHQPNKVLVVPSALPVSIALSPAHAALAPGTLIPWADTALGRHWFRSTVCLVACEIPAQTTIKILSLQHILALWSSMSYTAWSLLSWEVEKKKKRILVPHSLDILLAEWFLTQCLLAQGLEKPSRTESSSKIIGYKKNTSS